MKIDINTKKKLVPAVSSLLSDVATPLSAFHALAKPGEPAFLFESTETDTRLARFSFIGVDPAKTIVLKNGEAKVYDRESNKTSSETFTNPVKFLADLLAQEPYSEPAGILPTGIVPKGLPFAGGLVGYLGYGATRYFENIPQQKADPLAVPEGYYGLYDSVVVFDHLSRRIHAISYRGDDHARKLCEQIVSAGSLPALFFPEGDLSDKQIFDGVSGPFTKESYMQGVSTCKGFVEEGQVFQIVIAQRFSLPVTRKPLDIYRVLQAINPSPYAYFLQYPEFAYLGSSPETFVQCNKGHVILRALAGTRPRGATDEEDEALAKELKSNEKELAEHRMLVDLGRNDLGRICKPGTVKVGEIATLTKYAHVMHLATEVSGALQDGKTCFDVVQSCFPRGTVSGAPKIRAMRLLSDLEPERRGIYSGVVGYFDFAGNSDGAIAIRSALVKDGQAHVTAGAGIVYDSDPEAEYNETRSKAKSVLKAIKMAEAMK